MTTYRHIVEGSEYIRTGNGEDTTLVFTVAGVSGNPAGRAIQATRASGVPRVGDEPPELG